MHNFVNFVDRQSNSQDFEGDSKVTSFTSMSFVNCIKFGQRWKVWDRYLCLFYF